MPAGPAAPASTKDPLGTSLCEATIEARTTKTGRPLLWVEDVFLTENQEETVCLLFLLLGFSIKETGQTGKSRWRIKAEAGAVERAVGMGKKADLRGYSSCSI